MPSHKFDLIVLGGGTAGFATARRALSHGATVAMVESDVLGGECPNTACVPTKALLRSAEMVEEVRRAGEYGVLTGEPTIDWPRIRDRARDIVLASGTDAETEERLRGEGIAVFRGQGVFRSEREVAVDGHLLEATRIVVTAGSRDRMPPIPGLEEVGFITHIEAIALEELPESLIVIGAGPVGVEFSQIFAPLGVRVTLLSGSPAPLPREDADISQVVREGCERQGIDVVTGVRVERVERCGGEKVAIVVGPDGERRFAATEILSAAGHAPNVGDLGLEEIGVAANARGLQVDDELRTSVPGIWGAGDVTGVALFTHVASYQGRLAADNAVLGRHSKADYRVVPRATFCRPEVASIGKTERELIAEEVDYRSASTPFAALEKGIVMGEREGLAKLLTGVDGQILGAHVVGARAGELIHEIAVAMHNQVPVGGVASTIHAFPNFAEIWESVARQLV